LPFASVEEPQVLVGRDVAKIAVFLDKHHVIGVDLPLLRRQPFETPLGPLAILVFALFGGTILQILPGLCEFFRLGFFLLSGQLPLLRVKIDKVIRIIVWLHLLRDR
jgi:hypothetical protein